MNNNGKENKKVYRVGIDARFFGLENKGLGRYTNELVEWLDKLLVENQLRGSASKFEYYIFLRKDNFDDYKPEAKNIYKIKADYQWYSWQEQILFPILLRKYKLNLMHFTHFNAPIFYWRKFIVTIHDLILFHYPTVKNTTLNKFFYFFKLGMYHLSIRITVRKAALIIAISEFTKKDIIESLKVSKNKIAVIYEGAEFVSLQNNNTKDKKNENTVFQKYGILSKYLLYVGNAYPHKNLERLVLAFDRLDIEDKNELQLILVGKKDYFYMELDRFIEEKNIQSIIITDYVSDYELGELYRRAELFVFPSLYEGFGLPPLEALVRGSSVVSSSKSSLLEILEDNVAYFDVDSVDTMKSGIENALANKKEKISYQKIGNLKKEYSWQKMTKKNVEIYKKVIDAN